MKWEMTTNTDILKNVEETLKSETFLERFKARLITEFGKSGIVFDLEITGIMEPAIAILPPGSVFFLVRGILLLVSHRGTILH